MPLGVGLHALHLGLVQIGEQAKIFSENVLRNANLALTCGAPPLFSREEGKLEARLSDHRHPHGGATATLSGAPTASL